MSRLFVYGILKSTVSDIMERQGATLLGPAVTPPNYELYCLGGFPAIREGEHAVRGEVWEVKDFVQTDRIEGHPVMYKRTPVDIEGIEDVQVYIYQSDPGTAPIEAGPDGIKEWEGRRHAF